MSLVSKSLSYTCKNYSEFYAGESAFRNLCEELTEIDFSALDQDENISSEEKDFLRRGVMDTLRNGHDMKFPMNIYSDVDGAPGLSLIYVACDGLPVGKLPSIEDVHGQWLAQQIASGWQNDGNLEQVIIAAYALADDGESPEQVVFMRRGIANLPAPANDLQFSKYFYPTPPWDYSGSGHVLYEGMAYARQIAALGNAEFLKFHIISSIERCIENIMVRKPIGFGNGVFTAAHDKFIHQLRQLISEAKGIGSVDSRNEVSGIFNVLSSEMDAIIGAMLTETQHRLAEPEQHVAAHDANKAVGSSDTKRQPLAQPATDGSNSDGVNIKSQGANSKILEFGGDDCKSWRWGKLNKAA